MFIAFLLQQLRVAVGAVDRDVAGRAVLVARTAQVVERRRLRAEVRAANRRVTLDAELRDGRSFQALRIRRAVRLVTRRAVSDRDRSVLEDERAALVRMAGKTWRFARECQPQTLDARTAMRFVTGRAFHSAASEAMRVRFVAEGRHLR